MASCATKRDYQNKEGNMTLNKTKARHRWMTASTALATLALLTIGGAPATADNHLPERYQANVMVTAGAAAGGSTSLEIHIKAWTTEEERQQILSEIIDSTSLSQRNRNRAVARALRGASKVGFVAPRASTSWPLHYAKEFKLPDGGRRILLATDRPVSFVEAYGNLQAGDFDVTILELSFDKDGKGEGILSLGTEVRWNEETEKLEVTNFSSQPIRLGNIRKLK